MKYINYETHIISNPLLPFRFHKLDVPQDCKHCSPNWHENIEILVCTRGSAHLVLDGRHFDFRPGDICIANAYCVHTSVQEENLDYHCLIIDRKFCEDNGIYTSRLFFRELIRDPETRKAFDPIVEAYSSYQEDDPFCIPDIRYAVLGFLRILCRKHIIRTDRDSQRAASRERVKQVLEYLKANYAASLNLQDVADHVGISKYYLSREFKEFTGSTIFETINTIRCTEAKRMIEAGASVTEAALKSGYENLSYFTRSFKKHLGELPSSFTQK